MKYLLFLVSVFGTIFKSESIDLCIYLNNCPPGSPFHKNDNNYEPPIPSYDTNGGIAATTPTTIPTTPTIAVTISKLICIKY